MRVSQTSVIQVLKNCHPLTWCVCGIVLVFTLQWSIAFYLCQSLLPRMRVLSTLNRIGVRSAMTRHFTSPTGTKLCVCLSIELPRSGLGRTVLEMLACSCACMRVCVRACRFGLIRLVIRRATCTSITQLTGSDQIRSDHALRVTGPSPWFRAAILRSGVNGVKKRVHNRIWIVRNATWSWCKSVYEAHKVHVTAERFTIGQTNHQFWKQTVFGSACLSLGCRGRYENSWHCWPIGIIIS